MSECESICRWRDDIDSLAFRPAGHAGQCVIHRRAFRALLTTDTTPDNCCDYFQSHRAAFENAAAAKIQRRRLDTTENFHLNSRDIRRALVAA